jgi:hypothetical protein
MTALEENIARFSPANAIPPDFCSDKDAGSEKGVPRYGHDKMGARVSGLGLKWSRSSISSAAVERVAAAAGHSRRQVLLEAAAVAEAGEGVLARLPFQLLHSFAPAPGEDQRPPAEPLGRCPTLPGPAAGSTHRRKKVKLDKRELDLLFPFYMDRVAPRRLGERRDQPPGGSLEMVPLSRHRRRGWCLLARKARAQALDAAGWA